MLQVTTKRFSLAEYHRLVELGFFTPGDRIELIRGELVDMAAKGTRHSVCNTKLVRELERLLDDQAVIRNQEPITLSTSEPEPDIALVRGQPDDYLTHHPAPSEILLLIEIADSSLEYDQTIKLALYAEEQIQYYWLFNLVTSQLERYSQPYQDGQGNFGYRVKQIALQTETVTLPVDELALSLNRVFPNA